jgi:hypothetical protein
MSTQFVFDINDPTARKSLIPPGSLEPTGVTPGTYTNATVTVNAAGQVTAASSGAGGGGEAGFEFIDDFLAVTTAGNLNWTAGSNGAGSGAFKDTTQVTAVNQGILDLRTGTSAGGRGFVRQSTEFVNPGAAGTLSYEALIQIPILDNGVDDFFVNVGFNNNTSGGQGTNAIAFRYDSGNWIAFARAGGVETTAVDTGVAPVAGQWTKLRVEVTPAGADFFVAPSGSPFSATPNASIPQASLPNATQLMHPIAIIQKQLGATLRRVYVDYIRYALELVGVR